MPGAVRELRVPVVDLRRQPGTRKHVDAVVVPAELGIDDDRVAGDVTVAVDLESTLDGIVVSGTVEVPWAGACRRCLVPVAGVAVADVEELYQEPRDGRTLDPEAFEIEGDQLDLTPMVRELALLELPDAPLCRPDCAGICPVCGADRNETPCGCDATVRDERWAALDQLRLDE